MEPIYDEIGRSYSVTRHTDPHIARQLYAELYGATRIVNIGAGTGSYEPKNVDLVANVFPVNIDGGLAVFT